MPPTSPPVVKHLHTTITYNNNMNLWSISSEMFGTNNVRGAAGLVVT